MSEVLLQMAHLALLDIIVLKRPSILSMNAGKGFIAMLALQGEIKSHALKDDILTTEA